MPDGLSASREYCGGRFSRNYFRIARDSGVIDHFPSSQLIGKDFLRHAPAFDLNRGRPAKSCDPPWRQDSSCPAWFVV
jgi:hypothetical protein